ncbi:26S proteasome non-ATPase regulatory subunit 10-like [Trichogramma pretiosum]|uniref:26S proteasome non-ATPase regulatory subunit 10-like n=1 Tax=Trichogramma pretiosum TaxID=7493 RepID=UPI0006C95A74|nr:26S proteasome non-ATPase regulatory subunit 10-like [Trichogramma pretiosum]
MMKNESLFPTVGNEIYFMKYALEHKILVILKALHANGEHIHEFRWEDGKSALHYLVEQGEPYSHKVMSLINFLLKNSESNYCDELGYSYLHGACFAGHIEMERFVRQGVDVNLDTYTCSALHIAAQYHHKEIVKILLDHGANPNQLDHREQSTPLHALACIFVIPTSYFYSSRTPVDEIVDMLVMKKANIEARNSHGDSPLQYAVSRFHVQVAEALLKNSASLSSLSEDRMFSTTFTTLELKSYPLTFYIIEMMKLLKSADYQMNMNTGLRMLKYWMEIRGNDTDHLIPYIEDDAFNFLI